MRHISNPNRIAASIIFIFTGIVIFFTLFGICSANISLTLYTEESANSHYTDKDGKLKGYVYELVLEMQKRMGDTTPITMAPWARGYHFAITEPNTAIFSTTFTEERRPLFKWVGPVSASVWIFYAKAGSGIKLETLDDARSLKSIGTYRDDVWDIFLKDQGFTNVESARVDYLNLKKLMADRISVWASTLDRTPEIAKNLGISMDMIEPVLKVMEKGLFIAFNKDTSDDIVNRWQNTYNEVLADGTMEAIYKKWNVTVPTYEIPQIP
ncbi:MAG: ABC transporter substrate-binding protein [Desulfamplus sp.]|nr:ABC transporter substrate-binding protein [Desulfamplus sp.]